MSKRVADGPCSSTQPAMKKVHFEPMKMGTVSCLEELEVKTLKFQNRKLGQRVEQRQRVVDQLRQRIEQLEKRQTQDDAVLNVINRYWNQLNEDMRLLLERFDAETADDEESRNESTAVTSFVALLSSWDKQELEEQLASRVQVSKRAVAKVLQAFDRLLQRNQRLHVVLQGKGVEGDKNVDEEVKKTNAALQTENGRLQELVTRLQEEHHRLSLKMASGQESVANKETEAAELQNRLDDMEYELNKGRQYSDNLEARLSEALEKVKTLELCNLEATGGDKSGKMVSGVTQKKLDELQGELEEQRELATNRMQELEKLHQDHRETLKEIEKLKMDIRSLPESVIVETTEYKCLQSQFSVLYNESIQLKTSLEESRNLLHSSKNAHLRQIEQMESEELMSQKKLRTEVIQLEDMLAQVRKEYEMLRIEFEQNLAANEQTGPINREMRYLITSLQNQNHQLKEEVRRFKRRFKDAASELARLGAGHKVKKEESCAGSSSSIDGIEGQDEIKEEPGTSKIKQEDLDVSDDEQKKKDAKKDPKHDHRDQRPKNVESELVRDLKAQLKKSQSDQKEMKLLLDMYKGVAKDQRDKVQLMAAEKKARQETDDLKKELRRLQELRMREERRRMGDEDQQKKMQKLEDQVHQLQKTVGAQKQEEEALLNEMEVTGQAFEDMQEQNIRLIQQLREKDDANFKLMSERIKSNQLHKLQREEKDMLIEQVNTLSTQVEAQNQVVRKLEEKERLLQNNLATVEKELELRQQALDMHKRKAIESAQSAADLKLHLEKYHAQMKEAQQTVAEKTSSLEQEAYRTRRYIEDIAHLKKRLERAKKMELASTMDEVLLAEIQEYKDQLTCPSCKVQRKDAVLTKCFHVFCFDCLRTRYETRQRKCPKCNATFGANDYHRIYIS